MKLSEAKILFEAKLLSSATVLRIKSGEGWRLKFKPVNPVDINLDIETHAGGLRVFKTIDAAVITAEKVGFKAVSVILDQ